MVYLLELVIVCTFTVFGDAEELRECREHEFMDKAGSCITCRQCSPGQELSMECGFGYGENAQCVPCRLGRFKDDEGSQKCKLCSACAPVNRFQRANCTATSNTVCGECLPGFYRKTKLSGFQDMECVPCGDPPPSYEPHCSSRVNLVPVSAMATSPRDVALAAVICSALASVLLALIFLCVIYCKRHLLEKKPNASVRCQDCDEAEFSCFDHSQIHQAAEQTCHCYHGDFGETYGVVQLMSSLSSDETRGGGDGPLSAQCSVAEGPSVGMVDLSQGDLEEREVLSEESSPRPKVEETPRAHESERLVDPPLPSQGHLDSNCLAEVLAPPEQRS